MKETMNITQALKEIKLTGKKIESDISKTVFVTTKKAEATKIQSLTIAEYKAHIASVVQAVDANIARRRAIKSAIAQSNAVTTVVVTGTEYTVAEAIELKTSLKFQQQFLDTLVYQLKVANQLADRDNADAETKAYNAVLANIAAVNGDKSSVAEAKRAVVTNSAGAADTYAAVYARFATEVLSGVNVDAKILSLQEELDNFQRNVDVALSVCNSNTVIEINY